MRHWLLCLFALLISLSSPVYSAANEEILKLGRETYIAQCARCHGMQGKGDGVEAVRLYVPPRDLTSGRFKFKSTKQGTPPSDDDLMKGILGHGVTGSGMPSFGNLEEGTKKAVIEYIKTLSTAFQGAAPEPIANPANMKATIDLKKGAEIYEKLQCALCHGVHGRANGTSAFTLTDAWQHPLRPTNLTQGWTYGGGPKAIDVYHRIMAGIDGAPMPSYEGAATSEEAWILSKYVASLQIPANWSDDIYIANAEGALPTGLDDHIWKEAMATDIVLDGYYTERGRRVPLTVNHVSVQAVGNKEGIAFRLRWDDPVKSDKNSADNVLMAVKPTHFSGDVRATLHTLYEPNSPALDLTLWNAARPDSIQLQWTNLFRQAFGAEKMMSLKTAVSQYEDGQWTLVFTRPFDAEAFRLAENSKEPLYVAFSIASGDAGETGLKRPNSRWMRLHTADKKSKHH